MMLCRTAYTETVAVQTERTCSWLAPDVALFCMADVCCNARVSTALVLGMCPALAFFEAGMLRSKNTISIVNQIFAGNVILSMMWLVIGFSLSFGPSIGSLTYSSSPAHSPFVCVCARARLRPVCLNVCLSLGWPLSLSFFAFAV